MQNQQERQIIGKRPVLCEIKNSFEANFAFDKIFISRLEGGGARIAPG